jgi:hypothetical protein
MSTLTIASGATLLTTRPGNGPFGFLFQSEALAKLMGQCVTVYAAATALVLLLAVVATLAERRTALQLTA